MIDINEIREREIQEARMYAMIRRMRFVLGIERYHYRRELKNEFQDYRAKNGHSFFWRNYEFIHGGVFPSPAEDKRNGHSRNGEQYR